MIKYVVLVLIVLAAFSAGYLLAHTAKFSENAELRKQVETIQQTKDNIDKEQAQLKEQIKIKETEAELKEQEISKLTYLISANGRSLANEKQKVQKAVNEYQKELANIAIPTDNYSRCLRLCESRRTLGYSCTDNFCDQYK